MNSPLLPAEYFVGDEFTIATRRIMNPIARQPPSSIAPNSPIEMSVSQ
jgi:hypothetical protein